ncbi:hypothetical protein TNCV_874211, partial [Trichonephila clavipes]
ASEIIEDGDYSADQVFNADETGTLLEKIAYNRTYIANAITAKDEKLQVDIKKEKIGVTAYYFVAMHQEWSDVETS